MDRKLDWKNMDAGDGRFFSLYRSQPRLKASLNLCFSSLCLSVCLSHIRSGSWFMSTTAGPAALCLTWSWGTSIPFECTAKTSVASATSLAEARTPPSLPKQVMKPLRCPLQCQWQHCMELKHKVSIKERVSNCDFLLKLHMQTHSHANIKEIQTVIWFLTIEPSYNITNYLWLIVGRNELLQGKVIHANYAEQKYSVLNVLNNI